MTQVTLLTSRVAIWSLREGASSRAVCERRASFLGIRGVDVFAPASGLHADARMFASVENRMTMSSALSVDRSSSVENISEGSEEPHQ